ncbi:branched-chain alpha-ketoacid dehydrogenase [Amylostereum chailletii]|nr:branched-chain alpha-ketoacid dehydrogenase [Amylostereum chailletii]
MFAHRVLRPPTRISRHFSSRSRRIPDPAPPQLAPLLASYTHHTPRPLTLADLLSFARHLTPKSVLTSVSIAQTEIPRRLATRIRSLEGLPFIVGTNPHIARILDGFRNSFRWNAEYPAVTTLEENAKFVAHLEKLVQDHANDIPTIAKGFQECARYMTPEAISDFLDAAIRNRIAVRLIAEQHVALTHALDESHLPPHHLGIVNTALSPVAMIRMCASFVAELCEASLGASPALVIDGQTDSTFAYVPVHLEYILTEVLKNAFRATVEQHHKLHGTSSSHPLPPVRITVSGPSSSAPSARHATPSTLSIRIRDQGGGVPPANMSRIFAYSFTTAGRNPSTSSSMDDESGPYAAQYVGGSAVVGADLFGEITGKGVQTGLGTIAGLGFGLPMSRLYAKYFGGSLDLFSLDGWGCDVLLKLRCLDQTGDLEI